MKKTLQHLIEENNLLACEVYAEMKWTYAIEVRYPDVDYDYSDELDREVLCLSDGCGAFIEFDVDQVPTIEDSDLIVEDTKCNSYRLRFLKTELVNFS